ncbi:MAG: hypothetical protein K0R99_4789, partial [Microbacterium sp.]|nr:hypothetical protein [Microbacterium sp.]
DVIEPGDRDILRASDAPLANPLENAAAIWSVRRGPQ